MMKLSPAERRTDTRIHLIACILPFLLATLILAITSLGWLNKGILAGEFGLGVLIVSAFVAFISLLVGFFGGLSLAWSRKKLVWLLAPLAALLGLVFCVFVGFAVTFSGMGC